MKRIILAVACAVSVQTAAHAQTAEQTIERALAGVSARAREATTVIKFNADYSYETLKEGTGRTVCYDRSDERGRRPFSVLCTSIANVDRMAQNRRFRMETADRAGESALVSAAEADGTRAAPEYGSVWIHMDGDDEASARIHSTVAVPGATTESTGFPDNRSAGGAYIMAAGTSAAHIMIPGR